MVGRYSPLQKYQAGQIKYQLINKYEFIGKNCLKNKTS